MDQHVAPKRYSLVSAGIITRLCSGNTNPKNHVWPAKHGQIPKEVDAVKFARKIAQKERRPRKLPLLRTIFAQVDLIALVFRCGAVQGGALLSRKPQCLGDEIDPLWRGALAPRQRLIRVGMRLADRFGKISL